MLGCEPQQGVSPAPGVLPSVRTPDALEVTERSFLISTLPQLLHVTGSCWVKTRCSEVLPQLVQTYSKIGMLISFDSKVA